MAKLYNLARMTTATTGTGTITLGSAASGFLTFALAGVTDAESVSYAIEDGTNREIGYGTYTSAGTTLTRNVVNSTNAGAAISLSGTAQVFITAMATDIRPGYGTSLPASPFNEQEYVLVDSVTAPTYQWLFRYNAGSSNTDKWEFVGGAPALASVSTSQTTASTTAVDLATVGPSFTVPRAGRYQFELSAGTGVATSGIRTSLYYKIGAAAAVYWFEGTGTDTISAGVNVASVIQLTAAASDVLKVQYSSNGSGGTSTFSNRVIRVTPIRVS